MEGARELQARLDEIRAILTDNANEHVSDDPPMPVALTHAQWRRIWLLAAGLSEVSATEGLNG